MTTIAKVEKLQMVDVPFNGDGDLVPALLSAIAEPDPHLEEERERIILRGDVPSPLNPPRGCEFQPFPGVLLKYAAAESSEIFGSIDVPISACDVKGLDAIYSLPAFCELPASVSCP